MRPDSIRIVVVDDHVLFRRGLIGLLSDMPEFTVIGEAANGREALMTIANLMPDVVLMDINMPEMDGIAAVRALKTQNEKLPVLMLTISKNDSDLLEAVRAGADGYILKNTEPEDLRKALIKVAGGEGVLAPEVTAPLLKALASAEVSGDQILLSERELQVLQNLALGKTTSQIASSLFISENTVKTHVRHILEKLGASNRTEAVSRAIQAGLLQRS